MCLAIGFLGLRLPGWGRSGIREKNYSKTSATSALAQFPARSPLDGVAAHRLALAPAYVRRRRARA